MDLIHKISEEKIGLIIDVASVICRESILGGYIIHGYCILETDPTVQRTVVRPDVVFLDMNFLYPSAMSH